MTKFTKQTPRGAGRKPIPESEKLQTVRISVKAKDIEAIGGMKEVQKYLGHCVYGIIKSMG